MGKSKWKELAVSIGIPFVGGMISGLASGNLEKKYQAMRKPPLHPPGLLFPIVWTILYTLMGISSWIVWRKSEGKKEKTDALAPYGIQLLMNFAWTPLFFGLGLYLASFLWIMAMAAVIVWMIAAFRKKSGTAALLQIPYLLWTLFAGYLNYGIYRLNR